MTDKWKELYERMARVGLSEDDLAEKFILGSGKGGQKLNKTSSCVHIKHIPSGLEVKCQKTRSRELNRLYARRALCEQMEERLFQKKSIKQMKIEKIRKQKQRRARRAKPKF